jgi:hypothetical protein
MRAGVVGDTLVAGSLQRPVDFVRAGVPRPSLPWPSPQARHRVRAGLQRRHHSVRAALYGYEHMFQSSTERLRAWLAAVDTALLGAPRELAGCEPAPCELEPEPWATHPHRRLLRWERERRAGSVPHPPAYCLCPVRRSPIVADREEDAVS